MGALLRPARRSQSHRFAGLFDWTGSFKLTQGRSAGRRAPNNGRIIGEAVRVGLSDIGQVFHPETHAMLALHEMPEDVRRAVASIKVLSREVTVEFCWRST